MLYLISAALICLGYIIGVARARNLGLKVLRQLNQNHKKELKKIHLESYNEGYRDGMKKAEENAVWDEVLKLMANPN